MHSLKYHIFTTASVAFFAFVLAFSINGIVRHVFTPEQIPFRVPAYAERTAQAQKPVLDTGAIINSGFFRLQSVNPSSGTVSSASDTNDLILFGTITGPSNIARALIKKRTEPETKIFKLWSDVYGYKLVRIDNTKVFLKNGKQVVKIDMFTPQNNGGSAGNPSQQPPQSGKTAKTLSRSEMQQRIKNNMDTMLQGLRAGPYVVNGKIEGYKLFMVAPSNYLSTLGARSGDIIKRINGQQIDSTEKLYRIWSGLNLESHVTLDLERAGQTVTYDYTFTD